MDHCVRLLKQLWCCAMLPESLAFDPVSGDPMADRLLTSGWPVWDQVALLEVGRPTAFLVPGGGVIRVPAADPGQRIIEVQVVVNGKSIEPTPLPVTEDALGFAPMSGRMAHPSRRLLEEFLALAAGPTNAALLAFARRWGSLGLVSQEPASLDGHIFDVRGAGELLLPRLAYRLVPNIMGEPLALWRTVLTQVRVVVSIADRLAREELGSESDWQVLRDIVQWPLVIRGRTNAQRDADRDRQMAGVTEAPFLLDGDVATLVGQRQLLACVLQAWLALGALRVQMEWTADAERPRLMLGTRTMFGGIVSELIVHLAAQHGLATCAGCGASFVPSRRPRADRWAAHAIYCATCRADGTAKRAASRAWRARNPNYFKERHKRKSREGDQSPRVTRINANAASE